MSDNKEPDVQFRIRQAIVNIKTENGNARYDALYELMESELKQKDIPINESQSLCKYFKKLKEKETNVGGHIRNIQYGRITPSLECKSAIVKCLDRIFPLDKVNKLKAAAIEERFGGLLDVADFKEDVIRLIYDLEAKLGITFEYCEIQLEAEKKDDRKRRCLYTLYANCESQSSVPVERYRTGNDNDGVSLFAFETNTPVWVNSRKEDSTLKNADLIDTWSGMTAEENGLPKYWNIGNDEGKTYIVVPLVFRGLHTCFGFISLESHGYKKMPSDKGKTEIKSLLTQLADIVAQGIIKEKTGLS